MQSWYDIYRGQSVNYPSLNSFSLWFNEVVGVHILKCVLCDDQKKKKNTSSMVHCNVNSGAARRHYSRKWLSDCFHVVHCTCLAIQPHCKCPVWLEYSSLSLSLSAPLAFLSLLRVSLCVQWQWREATEGKLALDQRGHQTSGQRRQPGGLRRRGGPVQRRRLIHWRVHWAQGEAIHREQRKQSKYGMRRMFVCGEGTEPFMFRTRVPFKHCLFCLFDWLIILFVCCFWTGKGQENKWHNLLEAQTSCEY